MNMQIKILGSIYRYLGKSMIHMIIDDLRARVTGSKTASSHGAMSGWVSWTKISQRISSKLVRICMQISSGRTTQYLQSWAHRMRKLVLQSPSVFNVQSSVRFFPLKILLNSILLRFCLIPFWGQNRLWARCSTFGFRSFLSLDNNEFSERCEFPLEANRIPSHPLFHANACDRTPHRFLGIRTLLIFTWSTMSRSRRSISSSPSWRSTEHLYICKRIPADLVPAYSSLH